jgi:hypothetical protein
MLLTPCSSESLKLQSNTLPPNHLAKFCKFLQLTLWPCSWVPNVPPKRRAVSEPQDIYYYPDDHSSIFRSLHVHSCENYNWNLKNAILDKLNKFSQYTFQYNTLHGLSRPTHYTSHTWARWPKWYCLTCILPVNFFVLSRFSITHEKFKYLNFGHNFLPHSYLVHYSVSSNCSMLLLRSYWYLH